MFGKKFILRDIIKINMPLYLNSICTATKIWADITNMNTITILIPV